MAVYGGFEPGTYAAWALNLFNTVFVTSGIARGLQVSATAPASLAVVVGVDATWGDGVCFLPNGAWLRIDGPTTLTVAPNNSGATRTDALVAQVDPLNAANLSFAIQSNWTTGFAAATNQLVIALISVPYLASQILSGDITMASAVAQITGVSASGSGGSLTASDGLGLTVQDNSATSVLSLVMTGLSTGIGRSLVLQTTDASAIGHQYTFDTLGHLSLPGGTVPVFNSYGGGAAGYVLWTGTSDPGILAAEGDWWADG